MLHGRMQSASCTWQLCLGTLLHHADLQYCWLCRLVLTVLSPLLAYSWKAWCMAMNVYMMIDDRKDGHGF